MKIGKYTLHIIDSGYFGLDGGAMFGIIPKPLWQKTNPSDEANRIKLATRNLLLTNGNRKILIDTGMGDKWDEKSKSIYAVDQTNSLEGSLNELNLKSEDITDVILTHLHFDHTGGSTKIENVPQLRDPGKGGGKLVPSFPNAKYYVQKKNYDWAIHPSERDKGSYLKKNFQPLMEEGILNLIDSQEKFDDEIEFVILNGHTFGQQLIKISDTSNTIFYCADLFPTTSHIPLPYVMGYDLQPLVTVEEKKKILAEAIEKNWKIFFEHDPETALATVMKDEKGFRVNEKMKEL
ncbi:MAG: MBL fold metallo-hydrolase [Ignavibacteria bacterium RBG_16_34_14]|nr:MAG: MBL fold metallo-hydrolase [Ignavibacteria bacterium RBG_16_34_14]